MIKLKYKSLIMLTMISLVFLFAVSPSVTVFAQAATPGPGECGYVASPTDSTSGREGQPVVAQPGSGVNNKCNPSASACDPAQTACGLVKYINMAINVLSGMVGILATILIILGGIRYSMAGGDPNAVQKAKGLIYKGIMVVVGFGLLYAIAQWAIPGGII